VVHDTMKELCSLYYSFGVLGILLGAPAISRKASTLMFNKKTLREVFFG
jgi:hypothetical protein